MNRLMTTKEIEQSNKFIEFLDAIPHEFRHSFLCFLKERYCYNCHRRLELNDGEEKGCNECIEPENTEL